MRSAVARIGAQGANTASLTAAVCNAYAPARRAEPGLIATKDLPRDLTSFVGRRRELGEVREAMSSTPLLTLIGPAGVGKTRLALRAASDVRRAFPDGVCLAQLAELNDPALLAETVAGALGLRDASARWPVSTLTDFLATRRALLILDNCEHLADASAVLADSLLRACPELKILCTSSRAAGDRRRDRCASATSASARRRSCAIGRQRHPVRRRAPLHRAGPRRLAAVRAHAIECCRHRGSVPPPGRAAAGVGTGRGAAARIQCRPDPGADGSANSICSPRVGAQEASVTRA